MNVELQQNNKFVNGVGIGGIFFLGPLSLLYFGTIFLDVYSTGVFNFDLISSDLLKVHNSFGVTFYLALIGGTPELVGGFLTGHKIQKKIICMELGLVAGMSFMLILFYLSSYTESFLILLVLLGFGLFGCYFGKKIGRFIGKFLYQIF